MKHLVNWIEIPTHDLGRAKGFYGMVLDTELTNMKIADIEYEIFSVEDRFNCGCLVRGSSYKPSQDGVVIYLDGGDDLSGILGRVEKAGGKILLKKTFLSKEAGYIGLFIDSEGNRVGAHSMS